MFSGSGVCAANSFQIQFGTNKKAGGNWNFNESGTISGERQREGNRPVKTPVFIVFLLSKPIRFQRQNSIHLYIIILFLIMENIVSVFKNYCYGNITSKAKDVSPERKQQLVNDLINSPFRSVVQAWSVLDFYDYKHLHAEGYEKYLGWPDSEITSEKILEIVHPDDKEAFTTLYYLVLEGLMNMPTAVKGIGHFCISYRVQTGSGDYVKVLETNAIVESDEEKNIPLICLSQMSRVDLLDKSDKVKYYFLINDENDSVQIMAEYLKQYSPVVNVFSDNEIKIVKLMRQGLTSQEIADKIFLSKHTIDKYRKNLLEKTATANTAELLTHMNDIGIA